MYKKFGYTSHQCINKRKTSATSIERRSTSPLQNEIFFIISFCYKTWSWLKKKSRQVFGSLHPAWRDKSIYFIFSIISYLTWVLLSTWESLSCKFFPFQSWSFCWSCLVTIRWTIELNSRINSTHVILLSPLILFFNDHQQPPIL